jgi:TM2 domain-containing membrane protein YozV
MTALWRAILTPVDGLMTVGKTAKGVGYVSVWVLIWGTAASLVDYILLKREIYASFSIGQGFTFVGYGVAAAYLAVKLAPRFLKQEEPPAAD